MWVRCNPNPLGKETGDCVIRAIAVATNQSWREAYWALCERYPKGVYVIGTGDHAIAVISGDWYDLHDSATVTPTYFWRVE